MVKAPIVRLRYFPFSIGSGIIMPNIGGGSQEGFGNRIQACTDGTSLGQKRCKKR